MSPVAALPPPRAKTTHLGAVSSGVMPSLASASPAS